VIVVFPIILKSLTSLKEIKCKILTAEEELPKSLRQCRENLQSRSLTTFEQFTDSLFLAWDQLSSIESNTTLSFQLPPLYRFDGLNAIVSEIVHPICKNEPILSFSR
jgi:hypothetical protein